MEKFHILIPIRGIGSSMSRLRDHMEKESVDRLVQLLLDHTIDIVSNFDYPITIVTADQHLSGEMYQTSFYYDKGTSLNLALREAITDIDSSKFLIIMPDLPGLTKKHLARVIRLTKLHDYVVVETDDHGTAMAMLPKELIDGSHLGPQSAEKLVKAAQLDKMSLAKMKIKNLGVDLDDIDDFNYWKHTLIDLGYDRNSD